MCEVMADKTKEEVITYLVDQVVASAVVGLEVGIPPMLLAEVTAQVMVRNLAGLSTAETLDAVCCAFGLAAVRLAQAQAGTAKR